MINMYTKLMFIPVIFMSPIFAMATKSMFMTWMTMEMGTMAFIFTLSSNTMNNWSPIILYFLIQSATSAMLLVLMITLTKLNSETIIYMINLTLFVKMGLAPMHSWVPWIMNHLTWDSCLMMNTLQKIIPLSLVNQFMQNKLIIMSSSMTVTMTSMLILKYTNIKKNMAYSSIMHTAWMMMLLTININMLILYFSIYSLLTTIIFNMFNKLMIIKINDLTKIIPVMTKWQKTMFSLSLLSMGGMPPLTGFLMKFFSIISFEMISILILWMIIMSLFNMFVYLRICIFMNFYSHPKQKTIMIPKKIKMNKIHMMIIFGMIYMKLLYSLIIN